MWRMMSAGRTGARCAALLLLLSLSSVAFSLDGFDRDAVDPEATYPITGAQILSIDSQVTKLETEVASMQSESSQQRDAYEKALTTYETRLQTSLDMALSAQTQAKTWMTAAVIAMAIDALPAVLYAIGFLLKLFAP